MRGLEQIARGYLRSLGFSCEYYVPEPCPPGTVTVKETGTSGSTRFLGRTMLTCQAWDSTRGGAESRANDAMDALIGRGDYEQDGGLAYAAADITECAPGNGPYRWDDPGANDLKRWQFTVEVTYNG